MYKKQNVVEVFLWLSEYILTNNELCILRFLFFNEIVRVSQLPGAAMGYGLLPSYRVYAHNNNTNKSTKSSSFFIGL